MKRKRRRKMKVKLRKRRMRRRRRRRLRKFQPIMNKLIRINPFGCVNLKILLRKNMLTSISN